MLSEGCLVHFTRDPLRSYFDECKKNEIHLVVHYLRSYEKFDANLIKEAAMKKKFYKPTCFVITSNSRLDDVVSGERYVDQLTISFLCDVAYA